MNDNEKIRKNKPVPESELPEWAKVMPPEERERYVHSPQCKVCAAAHNGRPLRSEIEGLVIERKTYTEVCNIVHDRYGLRLFDYNIGNHMNKHAPDYAKAIERLLQSELGEVLQDITGPIVDQFKFLLSVVQVSMHNLIQHPEEVKLSDGIKAAEKFHVLTQGLDIWNDGGISQEEINNLIELMQTVMTPEQRAEVRRRYGERYAPVSAPEPEGPVPESEGVMVDGEFIPLDQLSTLPPEEPDVGNES